MKKSIWSLGIILSIFGTTIAQQTIKPNEFKIGVFTINDGMFQKQTPSTCSYGLPYTTTTDINGNKTSVLNVLVADGFNIYQTYDPAVWISENTFKNELLCAQANGMQVEVCAGPYYKPSVNINTQYLGYGTNIYDNCGVSYSPCESPVTKSPWPHYYRPNIINDINNIFSQSPFKDIIWGYHISEEAAYKHSQQYDCIGWSPDNLEYSSFIKTQIPPTSSNLASGVGAALTYFKSSSPVNHKMIIMEANHGKSIQSATDDGEGDLVNGNLLNYNPQQYLQLLGKTDSRDVFFDGSYYQYPTTVWQNQFYSSIANTGPNNNWHYLGKFSSIDYEKTIVNQVHAVIFDELNNFHSTHTYPYDDINDYNSLLYAYNSDPANHLNANWLWFQTYTSIIHGVNGIWFWDFNSWDPNDVNRYANFNNTSLGTRFEKANFPEYYQNFVSNLSRELRYLVNKNIVSTDPTTVIYSKTNQVDPNCIVPNAATSNYIYNGLVNTYGQSWVNYNGSTLAEKYSENYGLRYTIRTNGTDVVMIVSNPINANISVPLNFNNLANPLIRNSSGVDVLFEDNVLQPSSTYYKDKNNRNSTINLTNNTVGKSYYIAYPSGSNKTVSLNFGPYDVHILKFRLGSSTNGTGWTNKWSNFGSGTIADWKVASSDKFIPGDFDGDGTQELLCIEGVTNYASSSLLKYQSDLNNIYSWAKIWNNNASGAIGGQFALQPTARYIVGNFDPTNSADELLCISPQTSNALICLLKYSNGNWTLLWSNNYIQSAGNGIYNYKDNLFSGDFDADGKTDVMGVNGDWITMFTYSGGNWQWMHSNHDYGSGVITQDPYLYRNDLRACNFDGDNKTDILGMSSWATTFTYNGSFPWSWGISNYSTNNIGGWNYPLASTDKLLIGNIDSPDSRDEFMFIQRGASATNARTMDVQAGLFTTNWTNGTSGYIYDWPVADNGGANTDYLLIKPVASEPKYLMAFRNYSGCGNGIYLVNMYSVSSSANYKLTEQKDKINSREELNVYPNPNSGIFTVEYSLNATQPFKLEIYSLMGQIVKSIYLAPEESGHPHTLDFDMSEFSTGAYIVKLVTTENSLVKKVFIVR